MHVMKSACMWCVLLSCHKYADTGVLQDLFNMIHSVSKEMITVIQCVPRIAERTTPAIAAQLKVCCCTTQSQTSKTRFSLPYLPWPDAVCGSAQTVCT